MLYCQCLLTRENTTDVAWIPKKFAVVGKILTIKNKPGWTVKQVYGPELEYDIVNSNSRDWMRTRTASDI